MRAGGEIGVNIQITRAVTDDLAIARAAFAPDEIAYLEKLAGQERSMLFFRLWACREAVLKTAGVGITEHAGKLVLRTNPQGALTVAASPKEWGEIGLDEFQAAPVSLGAVAWKITGAATSLRHFEIEGS